jgi:phosphonoacetaldehyde hydrolase
MGTTKTSSIKLVVFDWAGTLIDHGAVAPVETLVALFESAGVTVSPAQVRSAMGLGKREQIESVLRVPVVLRSFQAAHGRVPTHADVDALYASYMPAQLGAIQRRSELIAGALPSLNYLRARRIAVATNTGYFRVGAALVLACARAQGFVPDYTVCADDVPTGRPAPYMIHACMQALAVQHPREVLVVGDTPLDVAAARNAGCWSVAVAGTGNEVGLGRNDWDALPVREKNALLANAHRNLRDTGADFVIDSLAEFSLVVERLNERGLSSAA